MEKVSITIIIPTMNRINSLLTTIDSFLMGEVLPCQIVIIDQSKNHENVEKTLMNKYDRDIITYYYMDTPSSTKARNKGIELAKCDIIVFSDDDVIVDEFCLANINNIFHNETEVGLIAAIDELTNNSNTLKPFSIFSYLFLLKKVCREKGYVIKSVFGRYPQNIKSRINTEWAMGFFFAVRKELLIKFNIKWDENLVSYAYAEDFDFSYSFYKKGKEYGVKFIIEPSVKVKHLVSKEWRISPFKNTLFYIINREYLSYKHFKFYSRIMTKWSNFGIFLLRLVKRERAIDIIKAQFYCEKYRKEIRNGKISEILKEIL